MYIRVNDNMRLDRGPGSSLDEDLLAACLKALTANQFSTKLVVPPVAGGLGDEDGVVGSNANTGRCRYCSGAER
jgi:hypothetical protein